MDLTRHEERVKGKPWSVKKPSCFPSAVPTAPRPRLQYRIERGNRQKERRSGAVAIVNRLTVVTRNVGDFNQLGVPVLGQFGDLR